MSNQNSELLFDPPGVVDPSRRKWTTRRRIRSGRRSTSSRTSIRKASSMPSSTSPFGTFRTTQNNNNAQVTAAMMFSLTLLCVRNWFELKRNILKFVQGSTFVCLRSGFLIMTEMQGDSLQNTRKSNVNRYSYDLA